MKSAVYLSIFLILPFFHSPAQTDFSLIYPQPRQAYSRFTSVVFVPTPAHPIYLMPERPMHGTAAKLNAFLRAKGKDTLEIRMYAPAGMHLALYPQPRQQGRDVMLEWRTPGGEQATFVLTDLLGRTVLSRELPASGSRLRTTRITLPRLAVGVYIGVLRTGELIQVTKVTVR